MLGPGSARWTWWPTTEATRSGEFCQCLDLTCVATGWTEVRAVPNKAQRWCFEALLDIERSLPIHLLGIDSDNGSEFINHQLV